MIKPTELAICDVMKHSSLGLISFQPVITDKFNSTSVRVRNVKGRLFQVDLSDCNWPKDDEYNQYWREFPKEAPEV